MSPSSRSLVFFAAVSFVVAQSPGGERGSAAESRAAVRPPSPEEFLGRPLGDVFTLHADVLAYARAVAATSNRVRLETYGRTCEGRELILVTVSAPENLARLEDLRLRTARLGDPRTTAPGESPEDLLRDLPATVWLSFNVHGNEPSPTETFLETLYRFAVDDDDAARLRLRDCVTILDPCLNPDGRERYVQWFNGVTGRRPDPDPLAREHEEPWPGGRYNHYLFDLNRDWAYATQIETRARLAAFLRRSPQVHADFHEMGPEKSYFFFPAEKPVNANFPPSTLKWGRIFGEANAAAFDAEAAPYYTGEDFDLFFPGYGDTWPSLTGAIGMTYEMAGHGVAGTAYRRRDGTVLTLRERLRRHRLTAFATVDAAARRRAELLADWAAFRRTAIEEGRGGSPRVFLLDASDPTRADALVETLLAQGVEVGRTETAFVAERVRDVHGMATVDRAFPAGTYVVSLAQPLKRLAKTLLEPRTEIRELYFYDVSAWSLPLGFGVPCFDSDQPPPVAIVPVTAPPVRPGGVAAPESAPAAASSPVGWLLDGASGAAPFALCDLLRGGVKVRVARKEFGLGGATYARGTLLVRRDENAADVAASLEAIGRLRGVFFRRAERGRSDRGPDLGSDSFALVARPRVVLLGGEGVDASSFGAARFLLDRTYDLPHSVLSRSALTRLDPRDVTAVVLPEGRAPRDPATAAKLREIVGVGGVVVGLGSGAFGLLGGADAPCAVRLAAPPSPGDAPASRRRPTLEEKEEADRLRQAPGSFFLVELDPAHPLSFGYRGDLAAFKAGLQAFDQTGPGIHVGVFKDASPVSGYVNPDDEKALRGRSYVSVEEVGRGAFVLFADDPNFRGGRHGLSRLFLNACLLLPDAARR